MFLYVYTAKIYPNKSKKVEIFKNTVEVKQTLKYYISTNGEYIHEYRTRVPIYETEKILENKYFVPCYLYSLITENPDVDFFIGLLNECIQKQSKNLSKKVELFNEVSKKLTNFKKEE